MGESHPVSGAMYKDLILEWLNRHINDDSQKPMLVLGQGEAQAPTEYLPNGVTVVSRSRTYRVRT